MSTDTALVVIDVQGGMFSASDPVYQGDELLTRIGHLLGKARQDFQDLFARLLPALHPP